jgi:hypothetical protein
VTFRVVAAEGPQTPRVETTYTLADGDDFLTVTTRYSNPHPTPLSIEPIDRVRADRTFAAGADTAANVVWWDDEWFGQAYGIEPVGATFHADTIAESRGAGDPVRYLLGEASSVELAPGASIDLVRRVFPADNLVILRAAAAGAIRVTGAALVTLAAARALGFDPTPLAAPLTRVGCDVAAVRVESELRAARWVEVPPPTLWVAVEPPVEGSAFAIPAALNMHATAPRVKAPVASQAEVSMCCCKARWRAAVRCVSALARFRALVRLAARCFPATVYS